MNTAGENKLRALILNIENDVANGFRHEDCTISCSECIAWLRRDKSATDVGLLNVTVKRHVNAQASLQQPTPSNERNWNNARVCFTGFRNKTFEKTITDGGGYIVNSVSGNTTHLIYDNPMLNTAKIKKARSLGIELILFIKK